MNAPHKNENPTVTGQFADQNNQTVTVTPSSEAEKSFATMAAQFALRGHTLQKHEQGGRILYVVSRWDQSRTFTQWHDMQAFMVQVGGAK